MCGILGYYKKGGFSREDLEKAHQALNRMRHRGPDGEGMHLINTSTGQTWSLRVADTPEDLRTDLTLDTYLHQQADLVLAHRRLSIFDLSSAGHQPMRDHKGNVLSLNGEVYNFLELRDELKPHGHTFKTGSDTEVILAAFRQWGPDAIRRFNGMWSFMLWDPFAKKLLVSVDRIGIKQLYWAADGDGFVLASEVKAIRALRPQLTVNPVSARFYLETGALDYSRESL
ncbi:MAG: asparagine synthetase B, partial [Bacteroidota bacterium]